MVKNLKSKSKISTNFIDLSRCWAHSMQQSLCLPLKIRNSTVLKHIDISYRVRGAGRLPRHEWEVRVTGRKWWMDGIPGGKSSSAGTQRFEQCPMLGKPLLARV